MTRQPSDETRPQAGFYLGPATTRRAGGRSWRASSTQVARGCGNNRGRHPHRSSEHSRRGPTATGSAVRQLPVRGVRTYVAHEIAIRQSPAHLLSFTTANRAAASGL